MNRVDDFHGQPAIELRTPDGDRATVLLHGAHVASWVPAGGAQRLYLSARRSYGHGTAIRGGVPVIFPQFNRRGPDFSVPRHGFARTRNWQAARQLADSVTLRLADDEQTQALWPHPFALTMTVTLAPQRLDLALGVSNTGARPFSFTAALHTYLEVGDIAQASVSGLEGVRFLDTVDQTSGEEGEGSSAPLRFERETDLIWYDLPRPLRLLSPAGALDIAMEGFADAVVWNPWAQKCAALPDMADDDFRRMLCIEAAAIARPVTLAAGEHWLGRQVLAVP